MFCVAAELAALALAGPRLRTEIDATASHLGESFEAAQARAAELSAQIGDAIPVVYGSDLTASVAYRWKCQINENAKIPAYSAVLPEADHNEIEGWSGADGRFAAIFLEDRDQHPRERKRFELTAKAIEPFASTVINLETEGETRTDRVLQTVMLGDLLAIELADARGVDPLAVDVLEGFKKEMGRPNETEGG
jgi:glucose/mannose-6-phosphate isomerase